MLPKRKIRFTGIFAGMISLAFTCAERHRQPIEEGANVPVAQETTEVVPSVSEFSEASATTRIALIRACGRCHQSTLPTHKERAIAIYDLDQGANWHGTLKEENLSGILRRAEKNSAITKNEIEVIKTFLDLKRVELQE
ncbi:MAG TPA: hypothetical protein VKN36_19140 [Eudoraea sp.]|nr:hypothetical protein [Eudoraea sp.]